MPSESKQKDDSTSLAKSDTEGEAMSDEVLKHIPNHLDEPPDKVTLEALIAMMTANTEELGDIHKKRGYFCPHTFCTRLACAMLTVILGISICAMIVIGVVLSNDISYWSSVWTQTQCYLSTPPSNVHLIGTTYYHLYDVTVALNPAMLGELSLACIRQQYSSNTGDNNLIQVSPYPQDCWVMTGTEPLDPCLSEPCSNFNEIGCISWSAPPPSPFVQSLTLAMYSLIPLIVLPSVALLMFIFWHKGSCWH